MNILLGRSGGLAFYGNETSAVVLDTELDMIVASGAPKDLLTFSDWEASTDILTAGQYRLCDLAIESQEAKEFSDSTGRRMYSIPEGVQKEAKKALEWRKEHKRGGTPVGLNTARTLAKGGQIGIEKVRHIAKYFPRHEVDKKGKGWTPGEDKFPSNGRIAWALWGGDAAKRWASAIVERENKKEKSVRASGYADSFKAAYELEEGYGPEFMARVHMDGSGIDRLYKIEATGEIYVWDDNSWDDMGNLTASVWDYDRELDENNLASQCTHVLLDADSAMLIASRFAVDPDKKITIAEIDEEEQRLAEAGMPEEDWELVDRVMSLAGDPMVAAPSSSGGGSSATDQDGNYTEEERSEKAKEQPRDATGKFVKVGSRTVVGNDKARGSGTIDSIDYKNGKVNVRLDSGKTIGVASEYLKPESEVDGPIAVPKNTAPLDLSGILGEPRTPAGAKARLSGTLPPLDQQALKKVMNDWPSWVKEQRDYKLFEDKDIPESARGKGITEIDRKYMEKRYGKSKEKADSGASKSNLPAKAGDSPAKSNLPNKSGSTSGKVNLSQKGEGTKSTLLEKAGSTPSKTTLPEKAGSTPGKVNLSDKPSTGKSETGTKTSQKPAAQDSSKKSSTPADSAKKSKPAPATSSFDKDGKYITQEGDSLWTIAEKTKADGQTTEDQWLKILEANKDNLRSDDPNLIFPDERINVPGQGKSKPSDNRAPIQPKKSEPESAQERIRKAKQDEQRAADAKAKEDAKARADVQGKISKVKQDEARAAKPNVQEAMRKDKQDLSKAEADKKKQADAQEKIRNARNADRLDTTERAKEANRQKTQEAMRQDKKAISDAEAAKNKAADTQEKLRNARNADRLDTTQRAKDKAAQQVKDAMREDKKAISEAEAAKQKAADTQERLRNARNADRAATTARQKAENAEKVRESMRQDKAEVSKAEDARAKADKARDLTREARNADRADTTQRQQNERQQRTQEAMRQEKQGQSAAEARKAVADSAREGVRQEKAKESSGITKAVSDKAAAKTQEQLRQAKMKDTKVIKETTVEKVRAEARAAREALLKARARNDTYKKRAEEAQRRVDENNRRRGGN